MLVLHARHRQYWVINKTYIDISNGQKDELLFEAMWRIEAFFIWYILTLMANVFVPAPFLAETCVNNLAQVNYDTIHLQ